MFAEISIRREGEDYFFTPVSILTDEEDLLHYLQSIWKKTSRVQLLPFPLAAVQHGDVRWQNGWSPANEKTSELIPSDRTFTPTPAFAAPRLHEAQAVEDATPSPVSITKDYKGPIGSVSFTGMVPDTDLVLFDVTNMQMVHREKIGTSTNSTAVALPVGARVIVGMVHPRCVPVRTNPVEIKRGHQTMVFHQPVDRGRI